MAHSKPIRAIIGRFSYPYSIEALENALKEYPFESCGIISTGSEPQYFKCIPNEKQDWFISSDIRGCKYANVDWNVLLPLDEELIENMRDGEAVFMDMVYRLEWKKRVSYTVRKRWYLRHLRFWNDYIVRNKINLYLSAWMPHEIPDIIIYYLCKLHNIPVVYFECASMVKDTQFAEHDWEESSAQVEARYKELLQQYANVQNPENIPLREDYEERYQALVNVQGSKPPACIPLPSYWASIATSLMQSPMKIFRWIAAYASFQGIGRVLFMLQKRSAMKERNAFYDAHAVEPDMNKPFVYLPLQYQPEASTIPMGGCYMDQVLIAQLISAFLPEDAFIYVKEHPWESGWLLRDVQYYKDLIAIPNVRLLKRSVDTFQLREHCKAVATCTGTAGVEALFRGKPVLLFGHRFYQFASGVYMIHSADDCKKAMHAIFAEGKAPTLLECRMYLKAMEDTCVKGVFNPWHYKVSDLSYEEHVHANTEALLTELKTVFG